jgi:hypothetical protein
LTKILNKRGMSEELERKSSNQEKDMQFTYGM